MKKNRLSFLIVSALLALSSLVGCEASQPSKESKAGDSNLPTSSEVGGSDANSNGSGQNSSNAGGNTSDGGNSSSQGGGQQGKTNWTDAEKQVMTTNLYGVVLPFVAMDVSVQYVQQQESVIIQSSANMAAGFLASYKAEYEKGGDWVGGDVSYEFGVSNGCVFAYQKAVAQNGAKRYVMVVFGGVDVDASGNPSYSPTSKFYLQAYDPYEYEFPSAFIGQWLKQVYGSNIVPPAFQADYYNLDQEGVLYGYSERNIENDYKATVERSGNFTIDAEKNAQGYYVCHSNDGAYIMYFKYDAQEKVMILTVDAPKGWNAAKINEVFTKHNATPFELPAISDPNITFEVTDQESGGVDFVTIYAGKVTVQMLQDYLNALKAMGYKVAVSTVDPNESSFFTSVNVFTEGGMYTLTLSYSKDVNPMNPYEFAIYFQLVPNVNVVKAWPAASIARYVDATKDTVPAFAGTCYAYSFTTTNQYSYVTVHVDEGAESQAKDSYVATLTAAGYTPDGTLKGQPRYKSPNSEIHLTVACDPSQIPGEIEILVQRIVIVDTPWPAADIATALQGIALFDPITDTIPALNVSEASSCYVNSNYSYEFEIVIDGLAANEADFIREFKANGWTEDPYYAYDSTTSSYGVLISPNRQIVAFFDPYQGDLSIYVKCYFDQYYWEWPSTELSTLLTKWGVTRDTIPAFNTASMVFYSEASGEQKVEIEISVGEPLYQTALTDYCVALERIGYVYDQNLGGFLTSNHELFVKVSIETNGINVVISNATLVYKVVGYNNDDWSFENGLAMTDATNPEENYRVQYYAQFQVEANAKFKILDSANNWLGGEIADYSNANSEKFSKLENGDIKVNAAGTVKVYLKIYDDNSKAIWLEFEEEQVPPAVSWPNTQINAVLAEWNVTDVIPSLDNEAITAVDFTLINEKSFSLTVVGGSSLLENYKESLAADYTQVEGLWVSESNKIAIEIHANGNDLIITVALKEEAPDEDPAYKVVGTANSWDYESGVELDEVDNPDEQYSAQYVTKFDVAENDEFKLSNNTGDSGWLGGEILVNNAAFDVLEGGNIKAKQNGEVVLFLNVLTDGTKQIVIQFTPVYADGTWGKARSDLSSYLGEEYDIPDFQVEGATSYVFDENDLLVISFAEGTDMDSKLAAINTVLSTAGYHYSQLYSMQVNKAKHLMFGAYVDGNSIKIFSMPNDFDMTGYYIIILEYNEEYHEYDVASLEEAEYFNEEDGYTQYRILDFTFTNGMRFFIYDFNNEIAFFVPINGYSLGGSSADDTAYAAYIEYNEEAQAYVIKQDFSGNIYLKLKYGEDNVYIGFVEP